MPVELSEAVRARRMRRSFSEAPVPAETLDRLFCDALRAPTAGNTGGTAWVVLIGPGQTRRYWEAATTSAWRGGSRRWPGLSRAPVVALSLACPAAYVARYREPDKSRGSSDVELGISEVNWPVPYWFGDAAFGVMTLLLGATGEGLGSCFLGNFRSEGAVLDEFCVPAGWRLFGAVALGYPDGHDPPSPSHGRTRLDGARRVHFGVWGETTPPV